MGASTLGNRHGRDCSSQNFCTGPQLLPPRPEITANTGSLAMNPASCCSQVEAGPDSCHTCSCHLRGTMNIDLLYIVLPDGCMRALGPIRNALSFLSLKYCSITLSMPVRFTGSASGVTIVAKCSTVSVTPGGGDVSIAFR